MQRLQDNSHTLLMSPSTRECGRQWHGVVRVDRIYSYLLIGADICARCLNIIRNMIPMDNGDIWVRGHDVKIA